MQKLKVNAGKFLGGNNQVCLQKAQQQNKEEAFQDGDFHKKHINISPALTRLQNREIRESFLPRKFSAIR